MKINQHKNATTTLKIRRNIQASNEPISVLAERYGLSWATVKKWKSASSIYDKSSRPNNLRTDLTSEEIEWIVLQRKSLKQSLEDICFAFEATFPDKKIYPMKVYRCLARYGLNVLPKELKEAEKKIKKFKKYDIGYLHIDLMYVKRLNDKNKYYIFTCIDRVSKLAYVRLTTSKRIEISEEFLLEVIGYYPYKINYILTDNGMEFTYRGVEGRNKRFKPKKKHPYARICKENQIELRHTRFFHPWTNGMVERFNRKVRNSLIDSKYFKDSRELAEDLVKWINRYNYEARLKSLRYQSPVDFLLEKAKISEQGKLTLKQNLTTYRY